MKERDGERKQDINTWWRDGFVCGGKMQEEGKFPWSPRKRMRGPRRVDAGAIWGGEKDEKGEMGGMGGITGEEES